ncbi:hypothetical protein BD560DRAFT_429291 [Blakeslea trispora]|nr:hypothetical protein BD560DRAFT_429291 [Blakeslea trispora]
MTFDQPEQANDYLKQNHQRALMLYTRNQERQCDAFAKAIMKLVISKHDYYKRVSQTGLKYFTDAISAYNVKFICNSILSLYAASKATDTSSFNMTAIHSMTRLSDITMQVLVLLLHRAHTRVVNIQITQSSYTSNIYSDINQMWFLSIHCHIKLNSAIQRSTTLLTYTRSEYYGQSCRLSLMLVDI